MRRAKAVATKTTATEKCNGTCNVDHHIKDNCKCDGDYKCDRDCYILDNCE